MTSHLSASDDPWPHLAERLLCRTWQRDPAERAGLVDDLAVAAGGGIPPAWLDGTLAVTAALLEEEPASQAEVEQARRLLGSGPGALPLAAGAGPVLRERIEGVSRLAASFDCARLMALDLDPDHAALAWLTASTGWIADHSRIYRGEASAWMVEHLLFRWSGPPVPENEEFFDDARGRLDGFLRWCREHAVPAADFEAIERLAAAVSG